MPLLVLHTVHTMSSTPNETPMPLVWSRCWQFASTTNANQSNWHKLRLCQWFVFVNAVATEMAENFFYFHPFDASQSQLPFASIVFFTLFLTSHSSPQGPSSLPLRHSIRLHLLHSFHIFRHRSPASWCLSSTLPTATVVCVYHSLFNLILFSFKLRLFLYIL